jgi:hypothetical protein
MRTPITVLGTVAALGAVTGCGGSDGSRATFSTETTTTPSSAPTTPSSPQLPKSLRLPSDVPIRSEGIPADAVSVRVIRKWSGALTGGDIRRAARFFALPSKVQNGTPVLTLDTPEKRLIFNVTFPCGAKATKLEQATGGYTIVEFVLTERAGGDCGSGVGGSARCAIRVREGHIAGWYRIPLAPRPSPNGPGPGPAAPGTQIA